jgi:hypothetical protein
VGGLLDCGPGNEILLEKKDRSASSARSQPSAPVDSLGL